MQPYTDAQSESHSWSRVTNYHLQIHAYVLVIANKCFITCVHRALSSAQMKFDSSQI